MVYPDNMAIAHSITPDLPTLLHQVGTSVAVVGATDDLNKHGARIYRDLKSKGFTVFAVNPHRYEVDGDQCWNSVGDLPTAPTIVDFVVPPGETLDILADCLELGYTNVWIQPGAEDAAVVDYLSEAGFNYLINACVRVHARPVG